MMELGPDLRDDTRVPHITFPIVQWPELTLPAGARDLPATMPLGTTPTLDPGRKGRSWDRYEQLARPDSIKLSNMDLPGVQPSRTFTGADIKCVVHVLGNNGTTHPVLLANAQTLSYSVHREKSPVRALGHSYAVGFTRGCIGAGGIVHTSIGPKDIEDISIGDLVLSYDENMGKVSYMRCLNLVYTGEKEVYNIKLQNGTSMRLTGDHRVYGHDGWVNTDTLIPGDELLVPSNILLDTKLDIPDYYLELLAFAIGDGVMGSYKGGRETRFSLTPGKDDVKIVQRFKNICESEGIRHRITFNRGCYYMQVYNCMENTDWKQRRYYPFILWVRETGLHGTKSHSKYIPDEIKYGASTDQLRIFINRLWGTDGSIHARKPKSNISVRITYTTTSKRLCDDIVYILSRVGIGATVRYTPLEDLGINKVRPWIVHRHGVYMISIPQLYQYKFLHEIGIYGKEDRYDDILTELEGSMRYDTVDILEFVSTNDIKFHTISKYTQHHDIVIRWKKHPRTTLRYLYTILNTEDVQRFTDEYVPSCDKGVMWMKVAEIDRSIVMSTYDIEVEGNHNFFGAFLSHNSRTIAGSIVFTLFDREVLWDLIQSYAVDVDWAGEGEYETSVHTPMLDQLPPFDITITFANEHGDIANLAIYGVEIVDEGTVLSIDDLLVEKTCSWVARDIDMIRPYSNTSSFRTQNMDNSVTSEDINAFLNTLGNRRSVRNRGDSIHRYDIPYDYALFSESAVHNAKYSALGYNTPVVYTADNDLRWLGVATLVREPNTVEFKPDPVYPEWTVDSKWIVHTSNLVDGVEVSPGGHEMIKLYNGTHICGMDRIEVR